MKHKQRFFPPPGYIPRFYAYCRVSHKRQFDKGDSIESQEQRIRAYFEMKRLEEFHPCAKAEWGGVYAEPLAQSAYSKPFPSRPAGKELHNILKPGDHLCVDKFDRIFRDLEDFSIRRRWFKERGIRLHIVNFLGMCLEADSRGGDMMLSMFAVIAEAESMQLSQRISMARAARRASGRHGGTAVPYVCQCVDNAEGKKIGGRLVFHDWAVPLFEKITQLREKQGMSWEKVAWEVARFHHDKHLGPSRCQDLYGFWKQWHAMGKPDINTISFIETTKTWWAKEREEKAKAKAAEAKGPDVFGGSNGKTDV